jgi:hypothetical protein
MSMLNENLGKFMMPDWLVGTLDQIERAMSRRAKEWASAKQADGTFPPLQLVDAGPQAALLYETSDADHTQQRGRLYPNLKFLTQIMAAFDYKGMATLLMDYETHVADTAWGAFDAVVYQRAPNNFESTRLRLARIVPHLPLLSTTLVVDYDNVERPSTVAIDREISSTLQNWGTPARGPLEVRIEAALAEMDSATPDSIQERILASMLRLIPTERRLGSPELLTRDSLAATLKNRKPRAREELTGCTGRVLARELYAIDRELGRGRQRRRSAT